MYALYNVVQALRRAVVWVVNLTDNPQVRACRKAGWPQVLRDDYGCHWVIPTAIRDVRCGEIVDSNNSDLPEGVWGTSCTNGKAGDMLRVEISAPRLWRWFNLHNTFTKHIERELASGYSH
jgi:hypothetical protein